MFLTDVSDKTESFVHYLLKLSDWQSLPKNKPLLSVFLRLFGQEVSFFDLNQDVVQKVLKVSNQHFLFFILDFILNEI